MGERLGRERPTAKGRRDALNLLDGSILMKLEMDALREGNGLTSGQILHGFGRNWSITNIQRGLSRLGKAGKVKSVAVTDRYGKVTKLYTVKTAEQSPPEHTA